MPTDALAGKTTSDKASMGEAVFKIHVHMYFTSQSHYVNDKLPSFQVGALGLIPRWDILHAQPSRSR